MSDAPTNTPAAANAAAPGSTPTEPLAVVSRSARPVRPSPGARFAPAEDEAAAYERMGLPERLAHTRRVESQGRGRELSQAEYDKLSTPEKVAYTRSMSAGGEAGDVDAPTPRATVKLSTGEFDEATVLDALRLHADDAARRANMPSDPSGYEQVIPRDVVLPEGFQFELDQDSPVARAAQEFAHRKGFDQAAYSEMLGIYAGEQAREVVEINAARAAEVQKLGPAGAARVDSVALWLNARLGEESGGQILDRLMLASDIEAFEKLMRAFTSQGGGSYSQSHRDQHGGGLTEDEYQQLSVPERVAYTRQFDQQQSGGRRGGRR